MPLPPPPCEVISYSIDGLTVNINPHTQQCCENQGFFWSSSGGGACYINEEDVPGGRCKEVTFNIDGSITISPNTQACCESLGHTWDAGKGVCYYDTPTVVCTAPAQYLIISSFFVTNYFIILPNTSLLIPNIEVGTQLNISTNSITDTVTVTDINLLNAYVHYKLNLPPQGFTQGAVNITIVGCVEEVAGCTDPNAVNYNPAATVDDDSCIYRGDPPIVLVTPGCTDPGANNYNPKATIDDGSCKYSTDDEVCTGIGKYYKLKNNNIQLEINKNNNPGFYPKIGDKLDILFESVQLTPALIIDIDDDGSDPFHLVLDQPIIGLPTESIVQITIIGCGETPPKDKEFCDTEEEAQESVTYKREVQFRKNLESNDGKYYNNLDVTVRLDRMINYMLAESSVDKKGIAQDTSFDTNLKSPYADFFNEVVVVTSAKTTSGTEVTTQKLPISFKIGDGSKKSLNQFKQYFNVNQTVISSDPTISPPPSDYLEIEKVSKLDTNTSPLVLSLSSFDNRALSGFNENREFSNDLIAGAGKGGLIISPGALGYLISVTDSLNQKGINYSKLNNVDKLSTDERLFYRVTDIEGSTFTYKDQDGIIPSTIIDNGDNKLFSVNEKILDNSDISKSLLGMSETNPSQSFQNQYLKLYDRELIKEEVQMMGNFISGNDSTKSFIKGDFPLFKVEKEAFLRGVDTPLVYSTIDPIYLEAKTDDPSIKPANLKITLKVDFETEITNENLLGPQPLDNLKELKLTGGTYTSQPFITYG